MAGEIKIEDDFIAGFVSELNNPDTLSDLHIYSEKSNRSLHFVHDAVVATLSEGDFDHSVIEAVDTGAKMYEVVSAGAGQLIPMEFVVPLIAGLEKDSNFALHLTESMGEARLELLSQHPFFAKKLFEALQPPQTASERLADIYGLGAVAVMHKVHEDFVQFWQFEQDFMSDE